VPRQLTQKQERHVPQVHSLTCLNRQRRHILGQALRDQVGKTRADFVAILVKL
jgi:hypothetical protein